MRKLTNEEFLARVAEHYDNIQILTPYINGTSPVDYRCLVCGDVNTVGASHLARGDAGCRRCAGSKHKTQDEFIKELAEVNPNLEVIGKYINNHTKIDYRCKVCNHKFSTIPKDLLYKKVDCTFCNGGYRRTHDEFVSELAELKPTLEIIGRYINNKTLIKFKCKVCGYTHETLASSLLYDDGACARCSKRERKTTERFIEEMRDINPNLEITGEYVNVKTKVEYRCRVCNRTHESNPTDMLNGHGCPYCGQFSKGETAVRNILSKWEIDFVEQKRFIDCRNVYPLPFDFYLKDYNLCVEYQGLQHYEPTSFAHHNKESMEENLKGVQFRDQIKRDYCTANNINLLEIPYWDFDNIETILEKELRRCTCA